MAVGKFSETCRIVEGRLNSRRGILISQDGTGDYDDEDTQVIVRAIQKLPRGGTIHIGRGEYVHTQAAPIEITQDNIAIKAIEPNVILKVDDESTPTSQLLKCYDKNNIEIKGITLDGNKRCPDSVLDIRKTVEGVACGDILLENCTIKGQEGGAEDGWLIFVWDTHHERLLQNIKLINCKMLDYGTPNISTADSVTFSHCSNIELIGCEADGLPRPIQLFGCDYVRTIGGRYGNFHNLGMIYQGLHHGTIAGTVFYRNDDAGTNYPNSLSINPLLAAEGTARDSFNITVTGCSFAGASVIIARKENYGAKAITVSDCTFANIENTERYTTALTLVNYQAGSGQLQWITLDNLLFYHIGKPTLDLHAADHVDMRDIRIITYTNTTWQPVFIDSLTNLRIKGLEIDHEGGDFAKEAIQLNNDTDVIHCEGLRIAHYTGTGGGGVIITNPDKVSKWVGHNDICGKYTRNSGVGVLSHGDHILSIPHGLYFEPTTATLTPAKADQGVVFVYSKSSTALTVHSEADASGDTDIFWTAGV